MTWITRLFLLLVLTGIAIFVFEILNLPKVKGFLGEYFFRNRLKRLQDRSPFSKQFYNILLEDGDDVIQIDHIFVSKKGIFVIEQKTFSGSIYGEGEDLIWTLEQGKENIPFKNPLKQNDRHCKKLARFLDIPEEKIFSAVVFSGNCELKSFFPENVMRVKDFTSYYEARTDKIFGWKELEGIKHRIEEHVNETCVKQNGKGKYLLRSSGHLKLL